MDSLLLKVFDYIKGQCQCDYKFRLDTDIPVQCVKYE